MKNVFVSEGCKKIFRVSQEQIFIKPKISIIYEFANIWCPSDISGRLKAPETIMECGIAQCHYIGSTVQDSLLLRNYPKIVSGIAP